MHAALTLVAVLAQADQREGNPERVPKPSSATAPAGEARPRQRDDHYDQTKVPVEVDAPDPALAKIVLVAGQASHAPGHHEYFAGLAFFAELLEQTRGVHPVLVRDGWPKDPKIFQGARAVVVYADGGNGHPLLETGRAEVLQPLLDAGAGFAALHYGVNVPAEASERMLSWLGGHFDAEISSCPACTWTAHYKRLPAHPATRGVAPFALRDEWYFNMRFVPGKAGVTPLLAAVPPEWARTSEDAKRTPRRSEITAWAYVRKDGGRSFGYTGGHYHDNWGEENVRRLVTNAILWTAKVEVPKAGAPVSMKGLSLSRNLDDKRKR
jgi:type 1 glutamine amidotransferase